MKKYIFYIILFLPLVVSAQLQPQFTIYREQTATLNPAMPSTNYLISDFGTTVSATGRYQWIGVNGAPQTRGLNWETVLDDNNILFGAHLLNDQTGQLGNTALYARFAYKLVLSDVDKRFISIGLNAGGMRQYANLSVIAAKENIVIPDKAQILPDVSFGIFYNEGNIFYVGASVPQLLSTSLTIEDVRNKTYVLSKNPQHIYGIAGFYIDAPFLGNDAAFIEPTMWLRYIPTSKTIGIDLNVRAKVSQTFWFGAGFNAVSQALNIEVGSVLGEDIGLANGQVKIGLGYAVPLGSVPSLGQTAEVHLSYSFGK